MSENEKRGKSSRSKIGKILVIPFVVVLVGAIYSVFFIGSLAHTNTTTAENASIEKKQAAIQNTAFLEYLNAFEPIGAGSKIYAHKIVYGELPEFSDDSFVEDLDLDLAAIPGLLDDSSEGIELLGPRPLYWLPEAQCDCIATVVAVKQYNDVAGEISDYGIVVTHDYDGDLLDAKTVLWAQEIQGFLGSFTRSRAFLDDSGNIVIDEQNRYSVGSSVYTGGYSPRVTKTITTNGNIETMLPERAIQREE